MRTSAKAVAARLTKAGIKPYNVSEGDVWAQEDGNVSISEEVSVQVGHDYVNVVHVNDEGFYFFDAALTYNNLIKDINLALQWEGEGRDR